MAADQPQREKAVVELAALVCHRRQQGQEIAALTVGDALAQLVRENPIYSLAVWDAASVYQHSRSGGAGETLEQVLARLDRLVGWFIEAPNEPTEGAPRASTHTRLAFLLKGILSTADSTPAAELADRLADAALDFMAYENSQDPVAN